MTSVITSSNLVKLPQRVRPTSGLLITYAPPYAANAFIPDNGLASLAGVLVAAGHRVQILDYCTTDSMRRLIPEKYRERLTNIWGNIQARIKKGKPPRMIDIVQLLYINKKLEGIERREAQEVGSALQKVIKEREVDWVGFKLWNGAGFTMPAAIAAELKKHNPDLEIFAGGSHVDYFMENIFGAAPAFDVLVYADGEEALLRQVERIGGSREASIGIPNSIVRSDKGPVITPRRRVENLDGLPYPVYDESIYPAMKDSKLKLFVIDESRGCNNFCAFCGHSLKSGGFIISKSPERIASEIERLHRQFGANYFRFGGSSTPRAITTGVARELIKRELKIAYSAFARTKDADPQDFPVWKESGYFGHFLGIESGCQHILDRMKKKVEVEEAGKIVRASVASGLYTVLSFIFPTPGDSQTTMDETLRFVQNTRPSSVIVNLPIVIPSTTWAKQAEDFDIRLAPDYDERALSYPIRFLLPPRLWPKFPWEIDGKKQKQIIEENTQLRKAVEALGVPTGISDDMALMANALAMDPVKFRDLTQELFFTANADALDKLVSEINLKVTKR